MSQGLVLAFASKERYFPFSLEAFLVALTWRAISKGGTRNLALNSLHCICRLWFAFSSSMYFKYILLLWGVDLSFYVYHIQSVCMTYGQSTLPLELQPYIPMQNRIYQHSCPEKAPQTNSLRVPYYHNPLHDSGCFRGTHAKGLEDPSLTRHRHVLTSAKRS